MISGALALCLFLAQAPEEPPPPVSAPPLISAPEVAPEVTPPQTPLQQSLERPRAARQSDPQDRRGEEGEEPAPGTPTAWWKRSLASFGIAAGVGGTLGGLAALLSYEAVCGIGSAGTLCQGSDIFAIFALAAMTATFTIPAAVSIVGRALGGRAKYGHALIGSGLFGAAALIVALAMTGGTDVPIAVIPIFSSLMVLGSVASFELFSFAKEPKVQAQPVVGLLPGGGMFGLRATF